MNNWASPSISDSAHRHFSRMVDEQQCTKCRYDHFGEMLYSFPMLSNQSEKRESLLHRNWWMLKWTGDWRKKIHPWSRCTNYSKKAILQILLSATVIMLAVNIALGMILFEKWEYIDIFFHYKQKKNFSMFQLHFRFPTLASTSIVGINAICSIHCEHKFYDSGIFICPSLW